ncbi:MAG: arylsulfatase [Planctomycetota bacterium]
MAAPEQHTRRPNVLVILADDWGIGDISCLNAESKIPTPHTDALVRQGMVFTDAHSNSAVCTPTRYGLLTGRYAWRGRLKGGVLFGYSRELIEHDRPTVATLLKDAGYRTACIGKWHLGLGWHGKDGGLVDPVEPAMKDPGVDFAKRLAHGPHTVGFDASLILPASLDMPPYCYVEDGHVIEPPTREVAESPRPASWRGGAIAPGVEHETCLLEFTRRAETFLADHARTSPDEPFFLYLPLPSPHTPHVPRAPFRGKSGCGAYGDYVVEHDWSIGQVLAALDRHGFADDTLVLVTSDNGAHVRGGDFDLEDEFGHRSNHVFRGQKSDAWDGGHRVPFIARWPGHVAAGSTCDTPICLTDLMATCADITGQRLPDDAGEDSASFLRLLRGEEIDRPAIVHSSITGRDAIRVGRWKLIEGPGSGGWSQPSDDNANGPAMQLYDMLEDPEESRNVVGEHADVVERLLATLNDFRDGGRSVAR